MTLDEVMQQGWADHAEKTEEVADRLEAALDLIEDGAGAAPYMHLVNHAIGDHLGDRPRATRLCEAVVKRLGEEPGEAPLLYLAVARRLSGDDEGAVAAQDQAGDDPALGVRIGMLVAQGLMHAGDWTQADKLYRAQMATADMLDAGHSAERACAVVSNNIASEIRTLEERDADQTALMVDAAEGALRYWRRAGTWVNEERAHYLLALVHTAAGAPADGVAHADRALAVIAANGEQKVDEAFLYLARAAACRDLGDPEQQAAAIARAEALAATFEDEGLTTWFQQELAKAR